MKSVKQHKTITEEANTKPSGIATTCLIIGSIGLTVSVLTDTFAVIGRHTGIALLGSIEIVQAAIVVFSTTAMVIATLHNHHAKVHILTDRLTPKRAKILAYIAAYISTFYCLLLLIGTTWVILETWNEHERSELLHIPLTELRLMLAGALLLMSLYFLLRPTVGKNP